MLIEPIELLPTVYGILMISQKLDDDFLRYKNYSEYLKELVKYINEVYDLSQYDIKESIPEPISRLCEYTYEFKVVVEKLKKMNFIKRLFRLNYYNEKMNQFELELRFIMNLFIVDNDIKTNSNNRYIKENLQLTKQIHSLIKEMFDEKKRKEDIIIENNFRKEIMEDQKKLHQGMLIKKNGLCINEFMEKEYDYKVQALDMVNNYSELNPEKFNYGEILINYMNSQSINASNTESLPSWYINEINVEVSDNINSHIGGGKYTNVQIGLYNGAVVAKKVFYIKSLKNQYKINPLNFNTKDFYLREIEIWSKIKSHPFILQFYGASDIGKHPFIISEYCSNGTIMSYINSNSNLSPKKKLKLMHDIALGIKHLHSNKVIHGDIKSDNILISDNGTPKICDFGLSIFLSKNPKDRIISNCYITEAVRWKAPELFKRYNLQKLGNYKEEKYSIVVGKISFYSDIFSLGRLFYEVIFNEKPFYEDYSSEIVKQKVISGEFPTRKYIYDYIINNNILYSNEIWDMLVHTWKYDPFARINLKSITSLLNILIKTKSYKSKNNSKYYNSLFDDIETIKDYMVEDDFNVKGKNQDILNDINEKQHHKSEGYSKTTKQNNKKKSISKSKSTPKLKSLSRTKYVKKTKPLNVLLDITPISKSDSELEEYSYNRKSHIKKNKKSIKKHSSISFLTPDEDEDSSFLTSDEEEDSSFLTFDEDEDSSFLTSDEE